MSRIMFIMFAVMLAMPVFADSDRAVRKSSSGNKGIEIKIQEGHKTTTTTTNKSMGSSTQGVALDANVDAGALFREQIQALEQEGVQPFAKYRLISDPPLPATVGLSGHIGRGWVDTTAQQYYREAGSANVPLRDFNPRVEEAVLLVREGLTLYGSLIGQGIIYLQEDLKGLKGKGVKTKKAKGGSTEIRGMFLEDLGELAKAALLKAVDVRAARFVAQEQRILSDHRPCVMVGDAKVQCGATLIELGPEPKLSHAGVVWYGIKHGGLASTYAVASGQSWGSSYESGTTTERYKGADGVRVMTKGAGTQRDTNMKGGDKRSDTK